MSFISFNKALSARLRDRYPRWFRGESPHWHMREGIGASIRAASADGKRPVVLEVGGVDRPLFPRDASYVWMGLDVDHRPSADALYDVFHPGSVDDPIPLKADIIVSYALLEHLPDTRLALRNMRDALNEGGTMHHYHPCKRHPYALLLRLVGTRMQNWLISRLRPEAQAVTGYRTYFDGCGVDERVAMLRDLGFTDVRTRVFYRANEYFDAFVPAYVLISLFETLCERMGWTFFAAGVMVSFGER